MALFEVNRRYDRSLPALLSLEMRKRAALARALVLDPVLLFLDEPTTGLGMEADRLITRVLKDYQQEGPASILAVTSERPSVFGIADRIGLLENGRIVAEGTGQEMEAELKKKKQSSPSLE
jgi:ABC-type multidrug transport system ATPase subunit